jgi:hypothetical protein
MVSGGPLKKDLSTNMITLVPCIRGSFQVIVNSSDNVIQTVASIRHTRRSDRKSSGWIIQGVILKRFLIWRENVIQLPFAKKAFRNNVAYAVLVQSLLTLQQGLI